MKQKLVSVTIGIPAFNEEGNIGFLIKDLLKQKENGFKIDKIIVASDGSTDNTVRIVKSIKDKKIVILNNRDRIGAAGRQNQLCRISKSDYLILLNADTLIVDPEFVLKLVNKAIIENLDLISANLAELEPVAFFEKVLATSMRLKKVAFEHYKKGKNLYTCYGPARMFSKKLYQIMEFRQSYGEDAFSYLFCLNQSMRYGYAKNAMVFYKLPTSLSDHKKQSYRFIESQKRMIKEFGTSSTLKEYYLPYTSVFFVLPWFFIKNPIYTTVYLMLFIYSSLGGLINLLSKNTIQTWEVSGSTKQLGRNVI